MTTLYALYIQDSEVGQTKSKINLYIGGYKDTTLDWELLSYNLKIEQSY